MKTDPFTHGVWNCQSDYYENSAFFSVGGLHARGELQRPWWISEESWPEYKRGYEAAAVKMFGPEWRTVEFGWTPMFALKNEETTP